ncbi:type IV toxin-antitoxin system AbiEi family antitoxin domain-containing protein [Janibacter massiliensis]|uniref:type IV toxin-antitoxin system AbiEi family antitoxin domain-containing protein n=1 Tax=Janibacter massiliensis TaxID=2058291 RepID=UPI000D0E4FFB|nr:type IV toxin-antitoxin system AbiEi family antitoxin domain-containing protein [Janibacter massiliensis]
MTDLAVMAVAQHGGAATASEIVALAGRHRLRTAVAAGRLVRTRRGTYVLDGSGDDVIAASTAGGVVAGPSAAVRHGWPLLRQPREVTVLVPRNRGLRRVPPSVRILWADLAADEHSDGLTSPVRTVLDCARLLPFREALAVADAAVRLGGITRTDLVAAAASLRGPGAPGIRRVARSATPLAANPPESALRADALDAAPGFVAQPDLLLRDGARRHPDVGHPGLRIALECDSFAHHGHRDALTADCWRYTEFALAGWHVQRYAWEHLMRHPGWVRETIAEAVAMRSGLPPDMQKRNT